MLQSPRSTLLEPSFASAPPAARAELSVLTLFDSDSDSEVSPGLRGGGRRGGLAARPAAAASRTCAGGRSAVPTLKLSRAPAFAPQAGTPHSPSSSPCLMELTMEEVAAAARCASPPSLPTCALLAQLFPSAAGVSACVPSADGLGYACTDLLPRACTPGCPAGCCAKQGEAGKQCGKLVEPLPGGGLLAFALAQPPAEVERALMRAFAAALSDHLRPKVRLRPGLWQGRCGARAKAGMVGTVAGRYSRPAARTAVVLPPLPADPPAHAPLLPLCPSWPLIHLPSIPSLSHPRRTPCCRCSRRRRSTRRPPAPRTMPFGPPSRPASPSCRRPLKACRRCLHLRAPC